MITANTYWQHWRHSDPDCSWDELCHRHRVNWPTLYYLFDADNLNWDLEISTIFWASILQIIDPVWIPR
jgi:hypothetical protein